MKIQKTTVLLTVIPILLFSLSFFLRAIKGPYFYGYNLDPAYVYLLNSLNITAFEIPGHTDHPGTPLQLLGAFILFIKWLPNCLFDNCRSLNESVLLAPEAFLRAINISLNLLIVLAAYFSGLRASRYCGVVPAIMLQLSLVLFFQILLSSTDVSPEPFMVFWGLILIMTLIPEVFGNHDNKTKANGKTGAVLSGIALGLGIASKVTFLPLAGLILILEGYKKKVVAALSCISAIIVTTLPISSSYGRIYNWLKALLLHDGRYGQGDVGFPAMELFINNLVTSMKSEPFLFVSLIMYITIYLFIFPSGRLIDYGNKSRLQHLLLVGSLVIIAQIVITAKHPGIHYMLPAMVVTALMNMTLVHTYITCCKNKISYKLIGTLVISIICLGLGFTVNNGMKMAKDYKTFGINARTIKAKIAEENNCLVAGYYGSSLIEYALGFGDSFANYRYATKLQQSYPKALQYNLFQDYFKTFDRIIDKETIQYLITNKNVCFLLYGTPLEDRFKNISQNLIVKSVITKDDQALYRLEGFVTDYGYR